MTPKKLLIKEIEQAPDTLVDEVLTFVQFAKKKHYKKEKGKIAPQQPFSDFIEELVSDIPSQVIDELPSDGAVEHDHYLYGTPKQNVP